MEICLPNVNSTEQTQDWMSEFMKLNQCAYAWERTVSGHDQSEQEVCTVQFNVKYVLVEK